MAVEVRSRQLRPLAAMAAALLVGLLIAVADSSPGWDSTGVTAGALLLAGATTAYVGRDRPWVYALLVGLPTPVVEIAGSGLAGSLLALAFATVGAAIGWALARAS